MTKIHKWTDKQHQYFKENVKGTPYKVLREMINSEFDLSLTLPQVTGYAKRNNLPNGRDARFLKGQKAWNKGMSGLDLAGENGRKTQFKKGQRPINHKPVGSERINAEGYTEVKTKEPSTWRLKHRVVWEKENGPIPKGHVVVFADRNRRNFDLDNLLLISRKQLVRMNQNDLIFNESELTKVGAMIAQLHTKMSERSKGR